MNATPIENSIIQQYYNEQTRAKALRLETTAKYQESYSYVINQQALRITDYDVGEVNECLARLLNVVNANIAFIDKYIDTISRAINLTANSTSNSIQVLATLSDVSIDITKMAPKIFALESALKQGIIHDLNVNSPFIFASCIIPFIQPATRSTNIQWNEEYNFDSFDAYANMESLPKIEEQRTINIPNQANEIYADVAENILKKLESDINIILNEMMEKVNAYNANMIDNENNIAFTVEKMLQTHLELIEKGINHVEETVKTDSQNKSKIFDDKFKQLYNTIKTELNSNATQIVGAVESSKDNLKTYDKLVPILSELQRLLKDELQAKEETLETIQSTYQRAFTDITKQYNRIADALDTEPRRRKAARPEYDMVVEE